MTRISWFLGLVLTLVLVTACDSAITVVPTPTAVAALPSVVVFPDETDAPALPTDNPVIVPTEAPTAPPTLTPGPTPAPTPNATATATPTAIPTPTPSSSPTPSSTASATPTPTATPTSDPTLPGDMTLLGTWTTHFIPSPVLNGNGANIRVPAKRINDTVVKPGQLFQFIDAIVPVTVPPYAKGAYIHNGQFVLDPAKGIPGGGMCSASTTMFNAALRAGLKIVERHNHAVYIPRYPVGLDATVFSTGKSDGQDVKFVNDMDNPIVIRAYGLKRKVTFEIWGVDDGRTVKLSEPVITNVVKAPAYLVYTDSLPPGVMQHVQDRYDGFHSVVVRTVKDANGKVIWKDTFNSQYSMLPGLTNIGRKPGDPPDGTKVLIPDKP